MGRKQTFIMLKPDAVQRGLVGEIISRFERRGLKIVALKMIQVSNELASTHYDAHEGKPFYDGLIKYIVSGPVVAMIVEGDDNVVATVRNTVGATKPTDSAPGSIRGDFGLEVGRNLVHASDSDESAKAEIELWFGDAAIEWKRDVDKWIFE
ncbi:MAG: nucleoside-diphosphate kinase [Chloroflexota bacterium]